MKKMSKTSDQEYLISHRESYTKHKLTLITSNNLQGYSLFGFENEWTQIYLLENIESQDLLLSKNLFVNKFKDINPLMLGVHILMSCPARLSFINYFYTQMASQMLNH